MRYFSKNIIFANIKFTALNNYLEHLTMSLGYDQIISYFENSEY